MTISMCDREKSGTDGLQNIPANVMQDSQKQKYRDLIVITNRHLCQEKTSEEMPFADNTGLVLQEILKRKTQQDIPAKKSPAGELLPGDTGEHPTREKNPTAEKIEYADEEAERLPGNTGRKDTDGADFADICERYGGFLRQICRVAALQPAALILREKDLPEDEYRELAAVVQDICRYYQVPFFVHSYAEIAADIGCENIHLSIPGLRKWMQTSKGWEAHAQGCRGADLCELISRQRVTEGQTAAPESTAAEMPGAKKAGRQGKCTRLSVSCHSLADVQEAIAAGATQIVLGTIFETQCKPGLAGRGLDFVREVCDIASLPVYAIGGITLQNIDAVKEAGAAGGCMMSGFMRL